MTGLTLPTVSKRSAVLCSLCACVCQTLSGTDVLSSAVPEGQRYL